MSNFVKLRISNSNLLIEQGRHQNIPLENRLCPICKLEIENEYHFVIEVSNHQFISLRFSTKFVFFSSLPGHFILSLTF
jgi:hypothetical protein